ncbi:MAG: tyrosine-type recombinase/integrase [Candidatus Nanohalobium sp.]
MNYSINEPNIELDESVVDELENFKEYLEENHTSDKTVTDYFNYVKRYYAFSYKHHDRFGVIDLEPDENEDMVIDKINNEMVNYIGSKATEYGLKKYLDFKAERSGRTATRNANYLRSQVHSVGESTEARSKEDKIRAKIHSEQEILRIIDKVGDHIEVLDEEELKLFLQVMYETAGRFSDIARLRWKDYERDTWSGVKLDDNQILIHADRSKSKNSGTVKVTDSTRTRIEDFKPENVNGDEKIFFKDTDDLKKLYYRVLNPLKAAADKVAVDLEGTHDFRHSRLVKLGKKMAEDEDNDYDYSQIKSRLSNYARHSDEETTEIYIDTLKRKYQIDISDYIEIEDQVVES